MFCAAACADTGVGVRGAIGAAIGCIDRDVRKCSKALRQEFSERPRAHSAIEIEYWIDVEKAWAQHVGRGVRDTHLEEEVCPPIADGYYIG